MKLNMPCRTMRSFAIEKYATILTYFILVCMAAPVSAERFMSNEPNAAMSPYDEKTDHATSRSAADAHILTAKSEPMKKCLVCGIAHEKPYNIIQGEIVKPYYKYPWMVRLQFKADDVISGCGGTLISRFHILTAAHCISKGKKKCPVSDDSCFHKPSQTRVKFLTHDQEMLKIGPPVGKITVHPKYNHSYENDVALLKLKKPVKCNKFTSPICLPSASISFSMKSMYGVSGWGKNEEPQPKRPSDTWIGSGQKEKTKALLEGHVLLINPDTCKLKSNLTHCVTGLNGTSPCQGDSGGPMFFQKEKEYYLAGVGSMHSSQRCKPDKPLYFVNVAKHMKWIKKVTKLEEAHRVKINSKKKNGR